MSEPFDKIDKNNEELENVGVDEMEKRGDFFIHGERINGQDKGAIALERINRLYVVLGWISAAMSIFVSPLFVIAGITFGVILNKQVKRSGNMIILSNIALALINIVISEVILMLSNNIIYR
ncbi:MAG: hypothetical protein GX992_04660 [Clostridium sp.]|nr:hypothetical protein [Clostridium sp.]